MLRGVDRLQASISNLAADVDRKREINIPLDFELKELAWDFNGQVKFLDECSKDELLQVIKILCRRFSYITNPTDDKPSATNIYPE